MSIKSWIDSEPRHATAPDTSIQTFINHSRINGTISKRRKNLRDAGQTLRTREVTRIMDADLTNARLLVGLQITGWHMLAIDFARMAIQPERFEEIHRVLSNDRLHIFEPSVVSLWVVDDSDIPRLECYLGINWAFGVTPKAKMLFNYTLATWTVFNT